MGRRRNRRPRRILRRADLLRCPVLDLREIGDTMVLTVALDASQTILVQVGSEDAVRDLNQDAADGIGLPLVRYEDKPALILRLDDPPAGLAVGALVDLQIKFVVDLAVDLPLVEAVATRITRRPIRVPAGQITLPSIGMPR